MYAITCALLTVLAVQDTLTPGARRAVADLQYLAADEREGRGVGTQGLEQSGTYIADQLRQAGLRPGGPSGGYFQDFTLAPDAPAVARANLGGTAVRNVIGVIPGRSAALRGQVVVIGAHYDHLGLGGSTALDPDSTGEVHNGADDNASGTAVLLEIARLLKDARPARTLVLVAFTAEELGALGSTYYVKHAVPQPVDSIYTMLNLDMVGRLRERRLLVLGAATAQEFMPLLDSLNATPAGGFNLKASGDGWGPSDHSSFYAAKRPVLHFFTDVHDDYHRSTDDWQRINANGVS
ncbi:MAG: M20/M25/M40 family metallo-hydrolase, partial [Gemmatimonadales bacterium]